MREEEKYDLMEKQMAGELDAAEQEQFDLLLQNDPSFAEEVVLFRRVYKAMSKSDVEDLESKIGALLERKRTAKNRRLWPVLAVAASLLLLLAVYWQWGLRSDLDSASSIAYATIPKDLEAEFSVTRSVEAFESTGEEGNGKLTAFFELYRNGNFQMAIDRLNVLGGGEDGPFAGDPGYFHYYQGVTHLQLGNHPSAIKAFENVETKDLRESAAWYRALCLFELEGATERTLNALREISGAIHPNREEAEELLHALENR